VYYFLTAYFRKLQEGSHFSFPHKSNAPSSNQKSKAKKGDVPSLEPLTCSSPSQPHQHVKPALEADSTLPGKI
jgi:hypothetical protein